MQSSRNTPSWFADVNICNVRPCKRQVKINKHLTKQGVLGIREQFSKCAEKLSLHLFCFLTKLQPVFVELVRSVLRRNKAFLTGCGGSKPYIFAFSVAFVCVCSTETHSRVKNRLSACDDFVYIQKIVQFLPFSNYKARNLSVCQSHISRNCSYLTA